MPSWNNGESSQDSPLSDFDYGHGLSPRKPIPETTLDPEFTGYDDCDLRCNHDMPMYKFVCFEGENTGRRFLACGCKDEEMCDKVEWVDGPWPPPLQRSLVKLWAMHDEERDSRIHGNVEYATKNYQLTLQKKELEKKNMELHKQVGNALEYVSEITSHDLELEVAKREKAEQEVISLREEKKRLEHELAKRPKTDDECSTSKEENKKLEYYVAELLKLSHAHKDKMKKIVEICGE
ncbi:hypothetical protein ACQ4PT_016655 [Festuca glaucescens]